MFVLVRHNPYTASQVNHFSIQSQLSQYSLTGVQTFHLLQKMSISSQTKHYLQCLCLISWIYFFSYMSGGLRFGESPLDKIDPWISYGSLTTLLLIFIRLLSLLALPQTLCNLIGFLSLNTFPQKPTLRSSAMLSPFICIRVVTRGLYPNLVKKTVNANHSTLLTAGLENFIIQVIIMLFFKILMFVLRL